MPSKHGLCSLICTLWKRGQTCDTAAKFHTKGKLQFWAKSFGEEHVECNSLLAAAQKVSLVIFLINKLGHRGQLDICCALINGACRWRDKKKLLFFLEFLIVQKGGDISREPKWWRWKDKWHFALTLSLSVCWHNGTLRKSDMATVGGGSDFSPCYQPLPPRPTLVQSQTAPPVFLFSS